MAAEWSEDVCTPMHWNTIQCTICSDMYRTYQSEHQDCNFHSVFQWHYETCEKYIFMKRFYNKKNGNICSWFELEGYSTLKDLQMRLYALGLKWPWQLYGQIQKITPKEWHLSMTNKCKDCRICLKFYLYLRNITKENPDPYTFDIIDYKCPECNQYVIFQKIPRKRELGMISTYHLTTFYTWMFTLGQPHPADRYPNPHYPDYMITNIPHSSDNSASHDSGGKSETTWTTNSCHFFSLTPSEQEDPSSDSGREDSEQEEA